MASNKTSTRSKQNLTQREGIQVMLINETLKKTGGNKVHAARILGISVRTLRNKINAFGMDQWKVAARVRTGN